MNLSITLLIIVAAATIHGAIVNKKLSYICLSKRDDLCLGTSPGTEPIDADLLLQLKYRMRNEAKGLDVFKTRWDLTYKRNGTFLSSGNTDYCIQQRGAGVDIYVAKGACNESVAFWNTTRFLENKKMEASIQHLRTKWCATVMHCVMIYNKQIKQSYCNKDYKKPERSGKFQATSIVRLWPCWWTALGNIRDRDAQTFRNRLDCSVNCTVNMVGDGKCDQACANAICELDGGDCVSSSPTMPTESPTLSPTFSPTGAPSNAPSSNPSSNPTRLPTTVPTSSPSERPTNSPTTQSPTNIPSRQPSGNPSRNPTNPSSSPSVSPSGNPSYSPSTNPTINATIPPPLLLAATTTSTMEWWWWIIISILALLLLCCCCCCFYALRKRRAPPPKEKDEEQVIKPPTPRPEYKPGDNPPSPLLLEQEELVEVEVESMPPLQKTTPVGLHNKMKGEFEREVRRVDLVADGNWPNEFLKKPHIAKKRSQSRILSKDLKTI